MNRVLVYLFCGPRCGERKTRKSRGITCIENRGGVVSEWEQKQEEDTLSLQAHPKGSVYNLQSYYWLRGITFTVFHAGFGSVGIRGGMERALPSCSV